MFFSVVIPVYGCKGAIAEQHRRLTETLTKITDDYEIILVNDGCPQNSWEVIEALCKTDQHVKGIELSRNFGQMKAILAGLDNCSGEWVTVMDCDLQDRPEDILLLYEKAREGYDVVIARRAKRAESVVRSILAGAFYKVYKYATDGNYDGSLCNFSVVKKDVIDNYRKMREQHRGYVMYLNWLGYRQAIVDVERDTRYEGKSSYTLRKRFSIAFDLLTSQSDKILRLSIGVGFVMTLLSILAIIAIIIQYFTVHVSPGWSSIVVINFFIGGLIIMTLGVLGIYVGNTFMQTKDRPLYVIRQIMNDDQHESK